MSHPQAQGIVRAVSLKYRQKGTEAYGKGHHISTIKRENNKGQSVPFVQKGLRGSRKVY